MSNNSNLSKPLADRLRPTSLDEYIGQSHLVGEGKPLTVALALGSVFSMILWGPPGVGKTTLARIIAKEQGKAYFELSAVSAGKSDIKEIVSQNTKQKTLGDTYDSPVLFLDEIHRFNKAQQDYLLPFVETGSLILIGATTENPSFEVIPALLSRTKVFVLQPLNEADIVVLLERIKLYYKSQGKKLQIPKAVKEWLVGYADGDARRLLNLVEHAIELYHDLTLETLKATLQSTHIRYDKKGEQHYDTISAFIKSMRASDADAALYYLARMVEAGEDPKFIARRMVVFASEDIGLAVPTALVVANAVFEAVSKVGYPEAQTNLAHGVAYLSGCKKDRSAYDAYFAALGDVKKHGNLPIPLALRNAPTQLLKELEYGKNYEMYPDHKKSLLPEKISRQQYLPRSKNS
jgi:putative ATPase